MNTELSLKGKKIKSASIEMERDHESRNKGTNWYYGLYEFLYLLLIRVKNFYLNCPILKTWNNNKSDPAPFCVDQ